MNRRRRTAESSNNSIQSVDRALTILFMLADADTALTVGQIGERLGVHTSTASRLLSTLADQNVVVWDRNGYRLGLGLLRLAHRVLGELSIRNMAHSHLQRLSEDTGQSTFLAMLFNGDELYLDQVDARESVYNTSWIGRVVPAHTTSSGKILLAYLVEEDLSAYIARGLVAATPNTVTDPDQLRERLTSIRKSGYVVSQSEHLMGFSSVAAPIFDRGGRNIAAVALSGPSIQWTPERVRELTMMILTTASAINMDFGYKAAGDFNRMEKELANDGTRR
jgi:DNA-binding IclR family transcriptional regulator